MNNCIYCDDKYLDIQNAIFNGGIETLTDWVVDGMSMDFVNKIEHLPLTFSTDTCDFCHSAGPYSIFKRVADAEYNVEKIDPVDAEALVWTRTMLNMGWAQNRTVVFGHTPVLYLDDYIKVEWNEDEDIHPYKWNPGSGGTKIDMDTGAAFSNCAYVLNVLTMRAQGFEEKVPFEVKKIDCIQM